MLEFCAGSRVSQLQNSAIVEPIADFYADNGAFLVEKSEKITGLLIALSFVGGVNGRS
jgi:hypothetical protein